MFLALMFLGLVQVQMPDLSDEQVFDIYTSYGEQIDAFAEERAGPEGEMPTIRDAVGSWTEQQPQAYGGFLANVADRIRDRRAADPESEEKRKKDLKIFDPERRIERKENRKERRKLIKWICITVLGVCVLARIKHFIPKRK